MHLHAGRCLQDKAGHEHSVFQIKIFSFLNTEVGSANIYNCPLKANPLIFIVSPLSANPLSANPLSANPLTFQVYRSANPLVLSKSAISGTDSWTAHLCINIKSKFYCDIIETCSCSANYPPHPAGSFNYPHLDSLPTLAIFSFVKVRISCGPSPRNLWGPLTS